MDTEKVVMLIGSVNVCLPGLLFPFTLPENRGATVKSNWNECQLIQPAGRGCFRDVLETFGGFRGYLETFRAIIGDFIEI